jgi:dihydrofolate reductase
MATVSPELVISAYETQGWSSMRKIIVTEFITLDGVVEAPGGKETNHPHGGWQTQYRHPEAGKYKIEELASVDALLLGKNTYDEFSIYWPGQPADGPGSEFSGPINTLPKFVVSQSLKTADWHNSFILRDVATDVAALKNSEGGNILVYGSGTLVRSLLENNLVDELRLMLHPVIVGGGASIFGNRRDFKQFKLKHGQVFDNGVVLLVYDCTVAS